MMTQCVSASVYYGETQREKLEGVMGGNLQCMCWGGCLLSDFLFLGIHFRRPWSLQGMLIAMSDP